jgi:hypothetical protein
VHVFVTGSAHHVTLERCYARTSQCSQGVAALRQTSVAADGAGAPKSVGVAATPTAAVTMLASVIDRL